MMPLGARGSQNGTNGSEAGFNNTDANGNPISPIVNEIINFGWEYVWHCHILNHEEMDMMRPVSVIVNTASPDAPVLNPATGAPGSNIALAWTDRSPVTSDPTTWGDPKAEIGYRIERATGSGGFVQIGTALANATGFTDATTSTGISYRYRVIAYNAAGEAVSNVVTAAPSILIAAPTNLTATLQFNPTRTLLSWTDNATNETGFVIERSDNGGSFTQIAARGPRAGTGTTTLTTNSLVPGHTYTYRVAAYQGATLSAWSNTASVTVAAPPAAPSNLTGSAVRIIGNFFQDRVTLNWTDNANNETGFQIQRSTSPNFTNATTYNVGANVTTFSQNVSRTFDYYYRVRAVNAAGNSAWSTAVLVKTP
jgi:hypothetical protein